MSQNLPQKSRGTRHLGSSGTVNLGKAAPARFGGSAERSGSTTNPGFIFAPQSSPRRIRFRLETNW